MASNGCWAMMHHHRRIFPNVCQHLPSTPISSTSDQQLKQQTFHIVAMRSSNSSPPAPPPRRRSNSPIPTRRSSAAAAGAAASIFGGSAQDREGTALRWLQTSATRPKRHQPPERRGRGLYSPAHSEILTPDHARRQYDMVLGDMRAKDAEWLEDTPLFGATTANFQDHPLTCEEELAARRVLCVLGHTCEVDYCPLLLDLVPLLLTVLPEHVAYGVVRNMHLHRPFYFGTGHRYFLALMASFRDYMFKYMPETANRMAAVGADTEEWLGAIFYRLFVPLLPHNDVVRLLDLYLEDGQCFLVRLGLALFKHLKWRLKAMRLESPALWWDQLADLACSADFAMEEQGLGGLGFVLADYGSRVKRANLERIVALRMSDRVERELIAKQDVEPLRFLGMAPESDVDKMGGPNAALLLGVAALPESGAGAGHERPTSPLPFLLQGKRTYLKLLASFLPASLRQRALRCCYSSERHGRSLDTLYRLSRRAHPVFLLVEEARHGHLIGAYCPEPIYPDKGVTGTGACFLFRLTRPAVRYEWAQDPVRALEEADVFQLATPRFFAVGASRDSDHPGLKLDADLETGSSHACRTFQNLPLCGRGQETFRVSRVEVFHLVST